MDGEPVATVSKTRAKVQAKRGHQAPRHADSRSLVNEAITTMDLPRISYLHNEITKKALGLDRIEFVMTMAT